MESYDEVVGFDYTNENEWRNWIRGKFLPLYHQLSIILRLREYLEDILKTNLKEALTNQSIKEILLGGVTKEGEYTSNSLAKLYKDTLGVFINPKQWIACCKAGLDPVDNGIESKFEDTTLLTFVAELRELVEDVLSKVEIEPPAVGNKEIEEIINSPEKLLDVIRKLYKSIVNISANHDYHMFFILNTRCIPRFFIERAYPKLKDNFEKVAEILELEEKFVPNISDEKVRKEYTLIGHKENGFADILFDVQHTIWRYFNFSRDSFWDGEKWINLKEIKEIFSLVVIPTDLTKGFRERVLKTTSTRIDISKNIILISFGKFDCKNCIKEFEEQDRRHGYYWYDREVYGIEFILKNSLIEKVEHRLSYRRSSSGTKGYTSRIHDEHIPLTLFLSNLSPLLFLGIVSLVIEGNKISVTYIFGD